MKEENDDRLFRKWEVLKQWGIDGRKLAEYVCDGLPAYDRHGRLLPTFEALAIDLQGNHERFLTYLADQIAWLIIDDVKDFELVRGITPHDTAPAPAAPPVSVKVSAANFFTREGAIWHIGFEDNETRINHLDGLLYISFLLEKPGTPISCRKLYQAASGKTPVNVMSEGVAIGQELNIGGSKQAIGTRKASKICREEYQELDLKLLDAGIEEREEIQEKMAALIPYMKLKERNIPDPNDAKAQANMRKRLDTAYKAIGKKKGMKEMEKHLREQIEPDGAFGLSYTGTVAWEITL